MKEVARLTFDNGNQVITDCNSGVGREEIARHYIGRTFNLGSIGDDMHECVMVEFMNRNWKFGTEGL